MGLVFPPHPTYLQMDRKLCKGKKAELTFARSERWLQLYHAAYDLRSLIYNAHVGAPGSRRGQLWRDVSAGGEGCVLPRALLCFFTVWLFGPNLS